MKNLFAATILASFALLSLSDGSVESTLRQPSTTTTLDKAEIPTKYHRLLEDSDIPILGCILSDDQLGCVLGDIFGDDDETDTVIGCITGDNLLDIGCYLQAVFGADEDADDFIGQTINCIDANLFDLGCYLDVFLGGIIEDDDGLLGGFNNCLIDDTFNLGCYLDTIIGSNTDDNTEGIGACFDVDNVFDITCYLDNIFGDGAVDEITDVNATEVVDFVASGLLACSADMTMECAANALLSNGVTENSALTKCILMDATLDCFTNAVLGTAEPTTEGFDGTTISLDDIKDMILSGEIDITVPGMEGDDTTEGDTSETGEEGGSTSLWDVLGGLF